MGGTRAAHIHPPRDAHGAAGTAAGRTDLHSVRSLEELVEPTVASQPRRYRAQLLPAYALFVIGFFQDALSGVPMGVHTVTYVLTYNVILAQQRILAG